MRPISSPTGCGTTPPQALDDARVVRLLGSLHGREQSATERHAAFAAALEQVTTAGTEHPDLDSLERAESLAQTETERTEVLAQRKKIEAAQGSKRREREAEFPSLAGGSFSTPDRT